MYHQLHRAFFFSLSLFLFSCSNETGDYEIFGPDNTYKTDTARLNTLVGILNTTAITDSIYPLIQEGVQLIKKNDPDYAYYDIRFNIYNHHYWKRKGDKKKALDLLYSAKEICLKYQNCEIGNCLFNIARIDTAFNYQMTVDSMVTLYESWKKTNCIANIYLKMSEYYSLENNNEQAISLLYKAVGYAEKCKGYESCVDAFNYLGRCYFDLENYLKALESYESALKYENKVPVLKIAKAESGIASCYLMLNKQKEALDLLYKVKTIYENAKNYAGLALVISNIGACYHYQNKIPEAKKNYEEAIALYENLPLKNQQTDEVLLSYYLNLGSECSNLQKLDSATLAYKRALEISKTQNNNSSLAKIFALLADNYYKQGDLKEAENCFAQSMEIPLNSYSATSEVLRLELYGNYLFGTNRFNEALANYQKALQVAEKAGLYEQRKNLQEYLYKTYKKLGQIDRSLYYLERFISIKDSVLNEENLANLTRQQLLYEHQKYREERNEEVRSLEFQTASSERNMLLAALVGITTLFISLFLRTQLRQKQKTNDLLIEKNQNLESELKSKLTLLSNNLKNMEELVEFVHESKTIEKQTRDKLLKMIKANTNIELIKKIDYQFLSLHENFYKSLIKAYPDLTPNNLKLCTYIKMNLTTKEIASLQFTTVETVAKAKLRLRMKFNIDKTDESLHAFLSKF